MSLFEDPVEIKDHPFIQIPLQIKSGDNILNGVIEITTGSGPHPTIIFLHGFPGNEKNFDIAASLKRVGYNCVIFHYQGSWGSSGDYLISNSLNDVRAVITFLKSKATEYKIDKNNLIIIGHSFGGYLASQIMAEDNSISKICLISPWNVSITASFLRKNEQEKVNMINFANSISSINVDGKLFVNEILEFNENICDLKFEDKNILLIGAKMDNILPIDQYLLPIKSTFEKNKNFKFVLLNTEHQFSNSRIILIKTIYDWLKI